MYCSRCGSQEVEVKLDREQVDKNHFNVSVRNIDYYYTDEGENDLTDQEFVAELNVYTCQVCGHKFYEDNI